VTHNEDEALQRLHAVSTAPINGLYQHQLGLGIVGGRLYQAELQGEESARIAIRILRGEPITNFPPLIIGTQGPRYDWRELQRWKIDERRLPSGSTVLFRRDSPWMLYRSYLIGGATLLVLQAALIIGLLVNRSQRQRAQRGLAERLRFETLLSELSTTLLTHRTRELDRELERMLQRVGEEMGCDRAVLSEWKEGPTPAARATHSWTRGGLPAAPQTFEAEAYPWIATRLAGGEPVHVPQLEALPADARIDLASFERAGIRSLTVVPLIVQGTTIGALGLSRLHRGRVWPAEVLPRLQLLADVFANVLARLRADNAVRHSDELRRHAEDEAHRQREELAHALRVTTVAELTASLAHEVIQPLSAVITNARAGHRLLTSESDGEFRDILDDICRDAMRAGEVVQRVRVLLRKGEPERRALDVNQLVAGVTTLVRHDLERARVSLRLALGEVVPHVVGDPVQLQQVILNLLLNACDAISIIPNGSRTLDVATGHDGKDLVVVTVRDSGVGVPESELTRIFEPFVTTKPRGLGMGLAISRSIVESHKGRIWATRNADHGLTVHIGLPA
jgi:C4-dicarboxylate-specific signal transduction histidine kinase